MNLTLEVTVHPSPAFTSLVERLIGARGLAVTHVPPIGVDAPDVGRDVPLALQPAPTPPAPAFDATFTPPGSAVAQIPPLPVAPATAAAAAPLTVPVVPLVTPALPPSAPTPPALPSAPAAAVPPAPAAPANPAASGETDARGFTWDGRIHSSTKTKNADGTWRQKRGTAETYVKEIEALQIQARQANTAVAATVAALPVMPPAGAAVPPTPPAITFADLCTKFGPAFLAQKEVTWAKVNEILAGHGLVQFNQLMSAPALVPTVDAQLSALAGLAPGKPA
jgi:hypothetical protein